MHDIPLAYLIEAPANDTRKDPQLPDNLKTLLASATPGPWKSDGIRIGAGSAILAMTERLAPPEIEVSSRERNCNAHLMASARELAKIALDLELILSDERARLQGALADVVRNCPRKCSRERHCETCVCAISVLPKDYKL